MAILKPTPSIKSLLEIPKCKRFRDGNRYTSEQEASMRALKNEILTTSDKEVLIQANRFYRELIPLLRKIDLPNLSIEDIEELRCYYNYIFNHLPLCANDVYCERIFRIVKNADLIGETKSLENISFLKHPSKEIVKKLGKYNRANTPNYAVFYGAESINAALIETQPKSGEIITISCWLNKCPEQRIVAYPISHGKKAIENNPDVKKGYYAFKRIQQKQNPLLMEAMELIFDFLGDEFSKDVQHHLEYFFSAIYSERIFENQELGWNYEAIIYPSVKNKFELENLAIRSDFFDERFRIEGIYEVSVGETFYDRRLKQVSIFDMSYIAPDYIKKPKGITSLGKIIW